MYFDYYMVFILVVPERKGFSSKRISFLSMCNARGIMSWKKKTDANKESSANEKRLRKPIHHNSSNNNKLADELELRLIVLDREVLMRRSTMEQKQ
ncbi:hypothetical protein M5689_000464 [Euphorbia peplus]|nr:hypothetical protein M5689_000464 [Euphorbia peplus]